MLSQPQYEDQHFRADSNRLAGVQVKPLPEGKPIARAYYKYELARMYGFSKETLSKYINRFIEQFQELGYCPSDKKLTKAQVRLLFHLIGDPD